SRAVEIFLQSAWCGSGTGAAIAVCRDVFIYTVQLSIGIRLKIESQIPFRQAARRRRSTRVLQVGALLLGLMAVLIGIVVLSPNWNLLRGPIAGYLSSKLDRQVTLD